MRYQDALLLQKQQAEDEERQLERRRRLETVAQTVESHYAHWLRFRDPFGESYQRIRRTLQDSSSQSNSSLLTGGTSLEGRPSTNSNQGRGSSDLDQTAFNLYRKLKFGQ